MKEDMGNEMVEVSREAIASLASQAAESVDGVALCQQKAVDSITSRVKREYVHKGVKVEKEDDGSYRLSVYLRVHYGVNIPSMANEMKKKIRDYVRGLTEIELEHIEIVVEDIETPA